MTNIYGAGNICFEKVNLSSSIVFNNVDSNVSFKQINNLMESNNGTLASKTVGWRASINVTLLNVLESDYEPLSALFGDIISDGEFFVYPHIKDMSISFYPKYLCTLSSDVNIEDIFERIEIGQSVSLMFESVSLLERLPSYIIS